MIGILFLLRHDVITITGGISWDQ